MEAFNEVATEWCEHCREWRQVASSVEELYRQAAETSGNLVRRLGYLLSGKLGDVESAKVAQVQYAFVAIVDETLLYESWPAQALWHENPLEYRLFGSRNAGEQVPDRIERLLRDKEPLMCDLAAVYLTCLELGFRGRLRADDDRWRQWCRQLFAFAYGYDPDYRHVDDLLRQASLPPPLRLPPQKQLPDSHKLWLVLAAGFLLLLGLSQALWLDIEGRLEDSLVISESRSGRIADHPATESGSDAGAPAAGAQP